MSTATLSPMTDVLVSESSPPTLSSSSAIVTNDHTFVTELFSLFAPLWCFSYVDCVQDNDCYISPSSKDMLVGKAMSRKHKKTDHQSTDSSSQKGAKKTTKRKTKQPLVVENDQSGEPTLAEQLEHSSPRQSLLQELIDEAMSKGQRYFGLMDESSAKSCSWELKNDSKGVQVFGGRFDPDDHIMIIKSFYTVDSPLSCVLQSLIDETFLLDLDTSLESFEVLLQPHVPQTICRRYCYKSYWPLTPRDVVVVTHWTALPDGRMLLCTVSVPNDWCPAKDSHVRAHIHFSGSLLRAVDEQRTEVTMINHSHLDTHLPASIINSAATGIPISFVSHFRQFLVKQAASLQARVDLHSNHGSPTK